MPNPTIPSLADAIEAGIAEAAGTAPKGDTDDVADTTGADEDAGTDGVAAGVAAGSGAGAEAGGDEPGVEVDAGTIEPDASADPMAAADAALAGKDYASQVNKHNADGTFKSKEQIQKEVAALAAADKVAKPAGDDKSKVVAPAAKKPVDHINDPIPKDLKPGTQMRMRALVETAKTLTTERDAAVRDRDDHLAMVQQTGANAEQYGMTLNIMRLFNSAKVEDREQALQIMQDQVSQLAASLGKAPAGVDPLTGHADLIADVQSGDLKRARAEEIALARNKQRVLGQQQQTAAQRSAADAVVTQARADLNAVETRLKADPHYAAKRARLVDIMQPVMAELHPSKWAAAFEAAYAKMPNPPAAARTPTPAVTDNQPLRTRTPAGGAVKAPTSMAEAVEAGLQEASGG